MKITLRPKGATDSSSDVVLADGADRADDNVRGPARAEISVSIAVQQSAGIRAAATRFFSRANRAGSDCFVASRRFAALAGGPFDCFLCTMSRFSGLCFLRGQRYGFCHGGTLAYAYGMANANGV